MSWPQRRAADGVRGRRSTTSRSPRARPSTTRPCWRPSRPSAPRTSVRRVTPVDPVPLRQSMRRARYHARRAHRLRWHAADRAPRSAFARDDGGQGFYGETNDKAITERDVPRDRLLPGLIVTFSLIQWRLDKRKHARMDAAKAPVGQRRLARRLVDRHWRPCDELLRHGRDRLHRPPPGRAPARAPGRRRGTSTCSCARARPSGSTR